MKITRKSLITGITHTRDIPVDINKYNDWIDRCASGKTGSIQREFPELSPGDREFIKTGITPEEWDAWLFLYQKNNSLI